MGYIQQESYNKNFFYWKIFDLFWISTLFVVEIGRQTFELTKSYNAATCLVTTNQNM